MAEKIGAKEHEGPVEDLQNARMVLGPLLEDYRNALDALGVVGDATVFVKIADTVRALEGVDKMIVKATVKLKNMGVK